MTYIHGCGGSGSIVGTVYSFPYSATLESNGSTKTWTAPCSGTFKIEAWGASSGKTSNTSLSIGKGGYTVGEISLNKDATLYVYVGGVGVDESTGAAAGGWNGGGRAGTTNNNKSGAGGGGATDIRTASGTWNTGTSLRSRIMVAGGGAGGLSYDNGQKGANGGGLHGDNGIVRSTSLISSAGATQVLGGTACIGIAGQIDGEDGAFGYAGKSGTYGGGGGGGYWGGGGGCNGPKILGTNEGNGSGGSSFVSGLKGAVAVTSASDTTPRKSSSNVQCTEAIAANDIVCSYHYSGYIFTNASTTSGVNAGDGKAKITIIE